MVKITKEAALAYHVGTRPGKIEVKPTKPYRTQTDLSLAYSPGVAAACMAIFADGDIAASKYTSRANLVGVITNGTAVLGLCADGSVRAFFFREGDALTVVDYKTDYVTADTLPGRAAEYAPQIRAYAAALKRVLGLPVREGWLFFLRTGDLVPVALEKQP